MRGLKGLTLVAIAALSLPVLASPADGSEPVKYNLEIEKQSLSTALQEFATQSGIQIIFFAKVTDGHEAPSLKGKFTATEAIARLLDHSDLTFQQINPRTIQVEPNAATNDLKKDVGSSFAGRETNFQLAQVDRQDAHPDSTTSQSQSAAENQTPETSAVKKKSPTVAEVVVTGSRIPSQVGGAAQDVKIYDRKKIEQSGQQTVSDFLNTLPSVAVGSTELGITPTVTLRGLPVGTTLVLINGRRVESSGSSYYAKGADFFDLNSLPLAAVDRVEVVADGSSAVYGSDAIGGVVNIILKKDFDGVDASLQGGGASGTRDFGASLAWGKKWADGAVSIVASNQDRTALTTLERSLTASNDYTRFGGTDSNYPVCNPANAYSPDDSALPGAPPGSGATYAALNASSAGKPPLGAFTYGSLNECSLIAGLSLIPETRRTGLFVQGHYDITPNVSVFGEIMYSHVRQTVQDGNQSMFGLPGYQSFTLGAANPYNPFGEDVGVSGVFTAVPTTQIYSSDYVRPVIGLSGTVLDGWKWEVSADSSMDWDTTHLKNLVSDDEGLQAALNATSPAAALNPFDAGSSAAQAYFSTGLIEASGRDTTINAFISGTPLDLPGGPVRLGFGGQHEWDALTFNAINDGYRPPNTKNTYQRHNSAVFGEARIPLLGAGPADERRELLTASVAGRYDSYSDFGGTTNPQLGIELRPTAPLLFRGTYATAFKAPSLTDLYVAQTASDTLITDPVTGQTRSVPFIYGGNPNLRPLTGTSWTAGVTFKSTRLPGFEASVTQWRVSEKDAIQQLPTQFIVDNEARFPGRVTRDAQGNITGIDDTGANFGDITISGRDYQLSYKRPVRSGSLSMLVSATQTGSYHARLTPGAPTVDGLGRAQDSNDWAPRWKGTSAIGWTSRLIEASMQARFTSGYFDYDSTRRLSNQWLFDSSIKVKLAGLIPNGSPHLRGSYLQVGGVNLFDRLPQFSNYGGGLYGYDPAQADIRGRYLYAKIGSSF